MIRIETDRMVLRDWCKEDFQDFYEIYSNPNVAIPEGDIPLHSELEGWSMFNYLLNAKNNYALQLKCNQKVIGGIGLNEEAFNRENTLNIGYALNEAYWNQGYMSEALTVVIANVSDIVDCLSCIPSVKNTKSKHLIEKFGFQYVKTFINDKMSEGYKESLYYLLPLK
jgi:[ribosomal protein S5]-alanine N-acetyltransferase